MFRDAEIKNSCGWVVVLSWPFWLVSLFGRLVGWLVGWLVARLIFRLVGLVTVSYFIRSLFGT